MRQLTERIAGCAADIVSEECGANLKYRYYGGERASFINYFTRPLPAHEWRFGGSLGLGGKLHFNSGGLYVTCYPEDRTIEASAAIQAANTRLRALLTHCCGDRL